MVVCVCVCVFMYVWACVCVCVCVCFLFFKQSTAYVTRSGDWCSDGCSSNLITNKTLNSGPNVSGVTVMSTVLYVCVCVCVCVCGIGRASCRERVSARV